jgi:predicted metal-dependent peptidase
MPDQVHAAHLDLQKLAAARLVAATRYPFLAVGLFALTPVAAAGLGTFAVDEQWRVFIDPEVLTAWTVDEVAGVLCHELGHVVRDHAERARACFVGLDEHVRWNVAGDAEINDDLLADGMTLPGGAVTPRSLRLPPGRPAEVYFALLESRGFELPHLDCGPGAHSLDDLAARVARSGQHVPPGLESHEADVTRRRLAVEILAAQRAAGRFGAGWVRWAEAWLHPVVDWRRALAGRIRSGLAAMIAGRTDYRYGRPPRRRVPGVVLPSLVRPAPIVAVVIDTSGSVSDSMLARAWTETTSVIRSVGVRRDHLTIWSTDADAHRLRLGAGRRVALIGGGGTDMGAGIAAAVRQRPQPGLIVVLTDGWTPWPSTAPGIPVVVGLLVDDQHQRSPDPPAWADTVRIDCT